MNEAPTKGFWIGVIALAVVAFLVYQVIQGAERADQKLEDGKRYSSMEYHAA
nr:hypothetical protein [Rhodococcus sp. (in: high G+C Gram-positive bacteria)]